MPIHTHAPGKKREKNYSEFCHVYAGNGPGRVVRRGSWEHRFQTTNWDEIRGNRDVRVGGTFR